jgi:hypothetical protein
VADRHDGSHNARTETAEMSVVNTRVLSLPIRSAESTGSTLFIAFTILYGIFASAYVALFPTSLVELFDSLLVASADQRTRNWGANQSGKASYHIQQAIDTAGCGDVGCGVGTT